MLEQLGQILSPLDYPRQAIYNLARSGYRGVTGQGGMEDLAAAVPGGIGALTGALAGPLAGLLVGGAAQGLGQQISPETFQATTPGELAGMLGGDSSSILQDMLMRGATDPLIQTGMFGGLRSAARGLRGGLPGADEMLGLRTPMASELPVDMRPIREAPGYGAPSPATQTMRRSPLAPNMEPMENVFGTPQYDARVQAALEADAAKQAALEASQGGGGNALSQALGGSAGGAAEMEGIVPSLSFNKRLAGLSPTQRIEWELRNKLYPMYEKDLLPDVMGNPQAMAELLPARADMLQDIAAKENYLLQEINSRMRSGGNITGPELRRLEGRLPNLSQAMDDQNAMETLLWGYGHPEVLNARQPLLRGVGPDPLHTPPWGNLASEAEMPLSMSSQANRLHESAANAGFDFRNMNDILGEQIGMTTPTPRVPLNAAVHEVSNVAMQAGHFDPHSMAGRLAAIEGQAGLPIDRSALRAAIEGPLRSTVSSQLPEWLEAAGVGRYANAPGEIRYLINSLPTPEIQRLRDAAAMSRGMGDTALQQATSQLVDPTVMQILRLAGLA